ncbi:hypothetical protein [Paenibacillus popilliae]|uniref:Uncharacterized protein n=1 Tax=Paenibacillus popilliae TaxID=78057 RepID=A0ABY3AN15_PAEPP|nr:hypothetical protein [Paenibacillus sp. SDF0028]TQR43385.1 hypothetical protein C7Y44_19705 [Paenibacillus sp. SDF0028]
MKRISKLSIMTLLTLFLLVSGAPSSFAKSGWADSFNSAEVMYSSTNPTSWFSATQYLDSLSDSDYYVIDNTNGSSSFTYNVTATPPPDFHIALIVIRMNADSSISSISTLNHNGRGYPQSISWNVNPGERVYFRVMDEGINNYSQPYTISFQKYS